DSEQPHERLLDASVLSAIYAPPGYLLYIRNGLLMAHRFDTSKLRLIGDAFSVAANIRTRETVLSASSDGLLTFGGDASPQRLVWFDRKGNELESIDLALLNVSISPDGRQIIGNSVPTESGPGGIWWFDLKQGVPTQIVQNSIGALWA